MVFGVESGNLLLDALLALFEGQLVLLPFEGNVGSRGSLGGLAGVGVSTNGSVSVGVHTFKVISRNTSLNEAAELLGISFRLIFRQLTHVISDVTSEDVLTNDFTVSSVLFLVKTGETLFAVRNIETGIDGTLHGGKDLGTSGGTGKTHIEESLESTTTVLLVEFSLVQTELGKSTTSAQKTSAVNGSVIGQTNLDTKLGKFVGVCGSKDDITLDLGINDLTDNVGVGDTDNETVLGGVVLVLVLDDQTLAGVVISLSLAATTVLDLETLVVGSIFLNFNEDLLDA